MLWEKYWYTRGNTCQIRYSKEHVLSETQGTRETCTCTLYMTVQCLYIYNLYTHAYMYVYMYNVHQHKTGRLHVHCTCTHIVIYIYMYMYMYIPCTSCGPGDRAVGVDSRDAGTFNSLDPQREVLSHNTQQSSKTVCK